MKQLLFLVFIAGSIFSQTVFNSNDSTTIQEISDIYDLFQETVKNKDVQGHRDILLYNYVPVNIIIEEVNGISFYPNNGQIWTNFFSNPNMGYELVISDIEYLTDGPIAITKAHFDEYVNNSLSTDGEDVFVYLKTFEGWKLAALHNTDKEINLTVQNPLQVPNNILELPDSLAKAIREKDTEAYDNLFYDSRAYFYDVEGELQEGYSFVELLKGTYFSKVVGDVNEHNIVFDNVNYEIVDNYIAVLTCDYEYQLAGEMKHSGKQYWVLMGLNESGWKASVILNKVEQVTSVSQKKSLIETGFRIIGNYPNPFNPSTNITYFIPESGEVTMAVVDALGREVVRKTIFANSGENNYNFDASGLSSGVYFYRVEYNNASSIKSMFGKMIYLK